MSEQREIAMTVNGTEHRLPAASVRRTLAEVLREELGLTGTHLGCEHGVCGACTVLVDGQPARSCLMLAAQADGASVTTIEGLDEPDGSLSALQQAFMDHHGFQCAFCAPGFLITAKALLDAGVRPDRDHLRAELSGNLCRCTGYHSIIESLEAAIEAGSNR
jgi:carbon-monoxide dehydrogenase small subunit